MLLAGGLARLVTGFGYPVRFLSILSALANSFIRVPQGLITCSVSFVPFPFWLYRPSALSIIITH